MSIYIYLLLFCALGCLAKDIFINKQLQAVGLQCNENKSYAKCGKGEFIDSTGQDWPLTNHETPALRVISMSKRFGIWGDSHAASLAFINSAIKHWGLSPNQIDLVLIQHALNVSDAMLAFLKSCLNRDWQYHCAHQSISSITAYSQSLLQLSANKTDALVWLDLSRDQLKNKVKDFSFNYKVLNHFTTFGYEYSEYIRTKSVLLTR